ncbi:8317_t:CDS:2 [Ambispora leptoticha]|uniref:8317_t:CDS:1 n=1 Tax=Ambispora leptoticha TaxID=144679 RepID=A0A9N8VCC6_9GLOM|nr:8317_t:CDS:2 [Ambispora leptoticha]
MIRYASPLTQVIIVALVLFLTSGMFNALNGMGGGGQVNTEVASNANVALYTLFSVGGFVAGGIVNIIGPRIAMAIGASAYALYAGSLLSYNHNQNSGAALVWTGQGAILTSYPSEQNKGKYIGIFWAIFNTGAVLGSILPLALNWHSTAGSVNDGTYIGFLILMIFGSFSALALLPPSRVFHKDGHPVQVEKFPTWKTETIEIAKLLLDWRMIALTPMFLASNWFYAYQFNDVNAAYFDVRTRAFNNLWYWFCQIIGATAFGIFLDTAFLTRPKRALYGLGIIFVFTTATWIGGLIFQLKYKRGDKIDRDLFDSGYGGELLLYMVYGLNDAMYQCYAYWIMGALTNDTSKLSRYNGFYKAVQSAGAAISWRIDAVGTAYLTQLLICWALLTVSIPSMFAVIITVKNTNYNLEEVDNEVVLVEQKKYEMG